MESVINGHPAPGGMLGHQVYFDVTYDDGKTNFCGVSILTPYYVLTAGHCFVNATSAKLIGSSDGDLFKRFVQQVKSASELSGDAPRLSFNKCCL
ncbi:hypothetical protein QR680_011159 [Steinernema hermaphroditum]|uniref:Peptidase S1 domain-containing protein n=1 Tax=Steinernema hermaphroditum TaxID=289476 RepID=A0AA39MCV9_9BILA|nr:hypothetical protein QR680_011159 [Steinernema hermaphroditum]